MIAAIALFVTLVQAQEPTAQTPEPTAGQVLTKMLARYSGLKSFVGTIKSTLTADGESASLDTYIQFEKPSFVYVRQNIPGQARTWGVISDGKHFSYNVPPELPSPSDEHLVEPVDQNGVIQTCQDIYFAASHSFKDRCCPLDIAFGRNDDLRYRRNQWVTDTLMGKENVRGQTAYVVGGNWREYLSAMPSGTYRMWITADGDLLRYEEAGLVSLPDPKSGAMTVQQVTSTWECDFKPGAETDKSLYVLGK